MTTDPYRIAADAYCPACGVKGRMVAEDEDRGDDGNEWTVESRTCVDCGHCHDEPTQAMDFHVKEMRIQFGRLIEGRPYEPPRVDREPIGATPYDLSFMEKLFRGYYGPDAIEQSSARWNALGSGPGYVAVNTMVLNPDSYELIRQALMEPEEVAGIGAWIPSKAARADCGCHPDVCCHDCCELKCGEGAED